MPLVYDALELIRNDGVALIDIVERHDPSTPVAACPGWDLADLAWHVGEVWDFWGRIVEDRLTDVEQVKALPDPQRPAPGELIEWVAAAHTSIYTALVDRRLEREVWTWTGSNQSVEWVRRRMAQETAVHRWDAAHAVGQPDSVEPLVASDGIDEFLTFFANSRAVDGRPLPGTVHLHCTDTPGEWFVSKLDADGIAFTREHTKGDVAIRGAASDLLLWLWRRDGRAVDIVGDPAVADAFRQASRLE